MTSRPDEVQARVHPQIGLFVPLRLLLLPHIGLMLVIDKVDDGGPRITVIDIVAKARRVNHGEFDLELFLLKLGLYNFNLGEFVELLVMATVVVFGGGEFGGEEGVDEGRLSQTGFTCEWVS